MAEIITDRLTFRDFHEDGVAHNVIPMLVGESDAIAFDVSQFLNSGKTTTGTPTVTADNGLVVANAALRGDYLVQADVSGQQADQRYELKCTVSTTDGQTIVCTGTLFGYP